MQLQVEPIGRNQNFNGLKIKKSNIKPKNIKVSKPDNLERKMSAVGWGIMFTGLLSGIVGGGITFINNINKNNKNKEYLSLPERVEAKRIVNSAGDSTIKFLQDSAKNFKHIK